VNGSTAHRVTWVQLFALAAAYAAVYEFARYLTISHWMLTAGLRLACLFLLPIRYWPALILGEALPSFENALLNVSAFGGAWALAAAVPMVLLWIPVVRPLRQRWSLRTADGALRAGVVLAATLGCAAVTAVSTTMELEAALLSNPGAWPSISINDYFWAYLLGAYLGALTLTPTVLAIHERVTAVPRFSLSLVWKSPLSRDLLAWILPICAGLAWVAMAASQDGLRQAARLALILPIFAAAIRHGWHGTALAGMAASVALAITGVTLLDPEMIRCQAVLALCISGTLLMGSRLPVRATLASPLTRVRR